MRHDATVWQIDQCIEGIVSDGRLTSVVIHHNDSVFIAAVAEKKFSVELSLEDGVNRIWAGQTIDSLKILSDTLELTLGYSPSPLVIITTVIDGDRVTLKPLVVDNPRNLHLQFSWSADVNNPAPVDMARGSAGECAVKLPEKDGDYYFHLAVRAGGDTTAFKTFVTRRGKSIVPFDMKNDRPSWIDRAVVYQITPYSFTKDGGFDGITEKLSELKELGINVIYLQPVYATARGGQGYDIVDYFSVRADLGTELQLRTLITSAKALDMRVMFDFVPNHTSIQHPYARSVKELRSASPYFDFYQHEFDGTMYSSHYNKDADGFVYYFWKDLVNLNYHNPEVQRWIIEACKYWVREFDIDGYRFDAVWAVNARMPSFGLRLRQELKSIKPDIFLLAEDKPGALTFSAGYDAAYDWTMDTTWVSQWSWAHEYDEKESRTIFNFPEEDKRAAMLREAILSRNDSSAQVLRFMENNDLPRFGVNHTAAQVRMVAALLMSLPGIPMVYNGQEVGVSKHPYSKHSVFTRTASIRSSDTDQFDYYLKLIHTRKKYSALQFGSMGELAATPSSIFAFYRSHGSERFIVLLNLGSADVNASISVGTVATRNRLQLLDVLTGETIRPKMRNGLIRLPITGYSCRWLLVK